MLAAQTGTFAGRTAGVSCGLYGNISEVPDGRKIPVREGAFVLRYVLTAEECAAYIALSEQIGYEPATITTAAGAELRPDIRNNDRVIHDDPTLAEKLWPLVADALPPWVGDRPVVGFNERFRFYRYDPGQRFDWHFDGAFERENGERSFYTVLFFLNDGFEGGETRFRVRDGDGVKTVGVQPVTGHALIFRHEMLHEGSAVSAGRKYILRTDVMYSDSASSHARGWRDRQR
ncbi:MAG: 2OG-Fe(II) oxygenase [Anaerolineae bacterium]|nr:2OG-Fe(II) oxygenase [Anaerolineae bacterium]